MHVYRASPRLDRAKYKGARISIENQAGFSRSQPIYVASRISIPFRAFVEMIVFDGSSLGVFPDFDYGRQYALSQNVKET